MEEQKVVHLVGNCLLEHTELQNILKERSIQPILTDESAFAFDSDIPSIYVFKEFDGPIFEHLRKRAQHNPKVVILGVPAVLASFRTGGCEQFPTGSGYPVYSTCFGNKTFSITGMRSKEKMVEMRRKILYLGGQFLEKAVKVDFLVVEKVGGERYRDACAIAVPVMNPNWINHLWDRRDCPQLDWESDLESWTCKAFYSLKIAFEGFDDDLKSKLTTHVISRDGAVVEPDDPQATHIVVHTESNWVKLRDDMRENFHQDQVESSQPELPTDMQNNPKRPRVEFPVPGNQATLTPASVSTPIQFHREKVKVVKEEWFWTTLQVGYCSREEPYLIPITTSETCLKQYDEAVDASIGTPTDLISPTTFTPGNDPGGTWDTPGSTSDRLGRWKRKRPKESRKSEANVSSLVLPDLPPKIITDITQSDATVVDLGGNSLGADEDVSDVVFGNTLKQINDFLLTADFKQMSPRQAEFAHLIETERNYVAILVNIVKNFKEPCEDTSQPGGAILGPLEIKTIFHTILPIYSLHRRLLRDLSRLLMPWSEDNLIGKVYCDHVNSFRRAYEPFVNFFEATQDEIKRCEEKDARFMAFLKIAQSRPESGKQSLTELLIRPIQRLPSTALILSALVKRTKDPNPDAEWMVKAVEGITSVNKAINEGKRVTEARIAMFDIYNDIDGCPVDIVSAQRSMQLRIDVNSITETWGQKNEPLSLIVFNDSILIVKRRANAVHNKHLNSVISTVNMRSPSMSRKSTTARQQPVRSQQNSQKPYKFVEMIYHVAIVRVVDIRDAPCFALIVREPHENRERVFGFTLPDDPNWPKMILLHRLAKLAADAVDRLDYEIKLVTEEYSRLEFSSLSSTVLEKASKFANSTRHKVSRALSLSRTPGKLKRTVSQMLSPFAFSKSYQNTDTSTTSETATTTPLRSNMSSLSLWGFGSRRGDNSSKPKNKLPEQQSKITLASSNGNFTSIQES